VIIGAGQVLPRSDAILHLEQANVETNFTRRDSGIDDLRLGVGLHSLVRSASCRCR
jgi:hypothetical protein